MAEPKSLTNEELQRFRALMATGGPGHPAWPPNTLLARAIITIDQHQAVLKALLRAFWLQNWRNREYAGEEEEAAVKAACDALGIPMIPPWAPTGTLGDEWLTENPPEFSVSNELAPWPPWARKKKEQP